MIYFLEKEGECMDPAKLIPRHPYLDWMNAWREKPMIKVVSGVRRCGKSTLFKLFMDSLLENGVDKEQIVSVNLEEVENERLLDYHALHEYVMERLSPSGFTYVFIDEVQNCKHFEKAIDSLFVKGNIDVYITGSNAYMLSGELATLLSGRYVKIEMLPLSFAEYARASEADEQNKTDVFMRYLKYGSFPAVASLLDTGHLVGSYLDGVYDSILLKDVAARLGLSDVTVLESIASFLFSNVGSSVSVKRIADTINSAGRTISINTVDKYLCALCDSYLFYQVNRYDIKGRQHLKTHGKFYAVDSGLRERRLAASSKGIGHVLENVVYLELIRRGNKVSIGKLAEKEVDFVAESADGTIYYQVSASVLDPDTLARELGSLRKISDNHPKILLTLDGIPRTANYDGIRQMHVIDWLLG
jgi:predicted AAA+ superfamily ATPase